MHKHTTKLALECFNSCTPRARTRRVSLSQPGEFELLQIRPSELLRVALLQKLLFAYSAARTTQARALSPSGVLNINACTTFVPGAVCTRFGDVENMWIESIMRCA
jgi:hypothetical protein